MKKYLPGLAMLLCCPVQAAVTFNVHADTVNTPSANSKNIPAGGSADMTVVLGESHISVQTGTSIQIYDFAKRRRFEIDRAGKTYVDYSLYDGVGFRLFELHNRAVLGKILSAAKADAPVGADLDNEHVLSLALPAKGAKAPELKTETSGGMHSYRIADTELLRASTQGTPVSGADAKRFAQFLRYQIGGHPLALRHLEQQAAIPASIDFRFRQAWGGSERTLAISDVATLAPAAATYDLSGYTRRQSANGDLDQLLDATAASGQAGAAAMKSKLETELQQAYAGKRALDALLITTELLLSSGEAPPRPTREQAATLGSGPDYSRFTAAMQAKTKPEQEAAVATLQALRKETSRPYVLGIYEANHRAKLGDPKAAIKLYTEALKANPYIAGAYKDLGDTLLLSYDMPRAWRSWDIGRQLAPGFRNFEKVGQFEATLLRNHPEYF